MNEEDVLKQREWETLKTENMIEMLKNIDKLIANKEKTLVLMNEMRDGVKQEMRKRGLEVPETEENLLDLAYVLGEIGPQKLTMRELLANGLSIRAAHNELNFRHNTKKRLRKRLGVETPDDKEKDSNST